MLAGRSFRKHRCTELVASRKRRTVNSNQYYGCILRMTMIWGPSSQFHNDTGNVVGPYVTTGSDTGTAASPSTTPAPARAWRNIHRLEGS